MAEPRRTATITQRPNLQDSPHYRSAVARLTELSTAAADAENAWREANDAQNAGVSYRDQQDQRAVTALLAGIAIAETPSDLDGLARDARVSRLAAAAQQKLVSDLADDLERASVQDDAERNDELALAVLAALRAVADSYETYIAFQADRRRRFNGRCSLPLVQLESRFAASITPAIAQFAAGLQHFGIVE